MRSDFLTFVLGCTLLCWSAAGGNETWGVVIDAGSSGSRIHVYQLLWKRGAKSERVSLPEISLPEPKLKTKPGLSSFSKNPEAAGESLAELIKMAKDKVPEDQWEETPLILSATAGLRLLPKAKAEAILESCYMWLKANSPFLIRRDKIGIISGRDEGAYGWLTMNFLNKRLEGMSDADKGTLGSIEMGGASTQVTFLPSESEAQSAPVDYTYTLKVGPLTYKLYTHSYLGFGQDLARMHYNNYIQDSDNDPCFPIGYAKQSPTPSQRADVYKGRTNGPVNGTGNFEACAAGVGSLFKDEGCPHTSCSFAKVYQPPFWLQSPKSVVLIENFFHTARV